MKAIVQFKRAENLLHVHYQNFGDIKILLNALDALDKSLKEGISYLQGEEKNMFKKVVNVYKLKKAKRLSKKMGRLLEDYRNSGLCFARKNKYVVCDSNLKFKEINFKMLDNYYDQVGKFLQGVEVVTNA